MARGEARPICLGRYSRRASRPKCAPMPRAMEALPLSRLFPIELDLGGISTSLREDAMYRAKMDAPCSVLSRQNGRPGPCILDATLCSIHPLRLPEDEKTANTCPGPSNAARTSPRPVFPTLSSSSEADARTAGDTIEYVGFNGIPDILPRVFNGEPLLLGVLCVGMIRS
jgi:hypothetical protein